MLKGMKLTPLIHEIRRWLLSHNVASYYICAADFEEELRSPNSAISRQFYNSLVLLIFSSPAFFLYRKFILMIFFQYMEEKPEKHSQRFLDVNLPNPLVVNSIFSSPASLPNKIEILEIITKALYMDLKAHEELHASYINNVTPILKRIEKEAIECLRLAALHDPRVREFFEEVLEISTDSKLRQEKVPQVLKSAGLIDKLDPEQMKQVEAIGLQVRLHYIRKGMHKYGVTSSEKLKNEEGQLKTLTNTYVKEENNLNATQNHLKKVLTSLDKNQLAELAKEYKLDANEIKKIKDELTNKTYETFFNSDSELTEQQTQILSLWRNHIKIISSSKSLEEILNNFSSFFESFKSIEDENSLTMINKLNELLLNEIQDLIKSHPHSNPVTKP